jgi:hypothetical protein
MSARHETEFDRLEAALGLLRDVVACADEGALNGGCFELGDPSRGDPPNCCRADCACVICEVRAFLAARST